MRAGSLDRRIELQRKTTSWSSSGQPVETWSTLTQRWANYKSLTGDERNAAQQWIAREQVKFTIRWSSDVSDFSSLDRIIFPATDASVSPVPSRSIYDVIAVSEEGRQKGIAILAARRVG